MATRRWFCHQPHDTKLSPLEIVPHCPKEPSQVVTANNSSPEGVFKARLFPAMAHTFSPFLTLQGAYVCGILGPNFGWMMSLT